MANTYTQFHIQIVIVVKNRQSLIRDTWKVELYKYITGIIQNYGHKVLQINGVEDHLHILIGLRPVQALSDLMKQVKQHSSKWINENSSSRVKFSWQEGFGAFSYSKSDLPKIIEYIKNQETHHKRFSFIDEYTNLLDEFEVEYDKKFIFKSV